MRIKTELSLIVMGASLAFGGCSQKNAEEAPSAVTTTQAAISIPPAPVVSAVDLNLEPAKYAGSLITLNCDYAGFAAEFGEMKGFCGAKDSLPVGIVLTGMDTPTFKQLLNACGNCREAKVTGVYDGENGIEYQVIEVPGLTVSKPQATVASTEESPAETAEATESQEPTQEEYCASMYRNLTPADMTPEAISEYKAECPEADLPVQWQEAAEKAGGPVFACRTTRHLIVIDKVGAGELRYRAWNSPKTMDDAPDMQIVNGTQAVEGSGACRYTNYVFVKGDAEFSVDDSISCTEEEPPSGSIGSLWVSVGGEQKGHYWCARP